MIENNSDIRKALKNAGVYQWQVCEWLGITEALLSKKMRHELSKDLKEKILIAIDEIVKEREEDV